MAQHLNRQKMFSLADQILRSGTSIGANVHEAQSSGTKKDFAYKMNIALKEARETHYWLYVIAESDIVPDSRLKDIKTELDEITRMLVSIVKTSRKSIKSERKK